MTKEDKLYFDAMFKNIEDKLDTKVDKTEYEQDKHNCYVKHLEPMKKYLWLIGIFSSLGGSLGTSIFLMYIKGKFGG